MGLVLVGFSTFTAGGGKRLKIMNKGEISSLKIMNVQMSLYIHV